MVQLWGPNFDRIDQQFNALHIKRDSYLNALLSQEIERLFVEVSFRNSDAVHARLKKRKLPDRKRITLQLDEALVRRIDEVLECKNISRDGFLDSLLFFLLAKGELLERLSIKFDRRLEATASPLEHARALLSDPLSHIRKANNGKFYTLVHFADSPIISEGPNLFAFNVAISDQAWKAMIADHNSTAEFTASSVETSTTTTQSPIANVDTDRHVQIPNSKTPTEAGTFGEIEPGPMSSGYLPPPPKPPPSTPPAKPKPGSMLEAFVAASEYRLKKPS